MSIDQDQLRARNREKARRYRQRHPERAREHRRKTDAARRERYLAAGLTTQGKPHKERGTYRPRVKKVDAAPRAHKPKLRGKFAELRERLMKERGLA